MPVGVSEDMINGSASFRDGKRFPACSWINGKNGAVLCRCSQPLPGRLNNRRSEEDEAIVDVFYIFL